MTSFQLDDSIKFDIMKTKMLVKLQTFVHDLYKSLSICTRMYVNEMLIFDNNYALRIGTV